MLTRAFRTLSLLSVILVAVGALAGQAVPDQGAGDAGGAVQGALLGLLVAGVAGVHLVVRTLFARVPESATPELAAGSVESAVYRRAGAATFPDAVSVMLLVALFSALSGPTAAGWLPAAGLVLVLADFAVRARARWTRLVAD